MKIAKGVVALMGSGEFTATMVEVHKELLDRYGDTPRAALLDTPAGFQLNVEQISERAVEYFHFRVLQELEIVSLRSAEELDPYAAQEAYRVLRKADFFIMGPGSPTYAVRHLRQTPVPEILLERIRGGACLVAASAAALTVGRFTLPVYEVYKVGERPHWSNGLDLLGSLGFDVAVIPHWNNAEGGTHDTRFCYMGEPRFHTLEAQLPTDTTVLGLDEHTACILDFATGEAWVRGIGSVTLRRGGVQLDFAAGERFPLETLHGMADRTPSRRAAPPETATETLLSGAGAEADSFWTAVRAREQLFHRGIEEHDPKAIAAALLEIDRLTWEAHQQRQDPEDISQAREVLRELIVLFGAHLGSLPPSREACAGPLVERFVSLREELRSQRKWEEADAIRDALQDNDVVVEDTPEGARWKWSP